MVRGVRGSSGLSVDVAAATPSVWLMVPSIPAAAEARVSDEVRQWWLAHLRASLVELCKAVGLESC